jgi:hypothetical protein
MQEAMWDNVRRMLPQDEPIPAGYEENINLVQRKYSCLMGSKQLSPEMQALILCLTRAGLRLNADVVIDENAKPEKLPDTITPTATDAEIEEEDLDFPTGSLVQCFHNGKIWTGEVVGCCYEEGDEGKLKIKLDGDKQKFRLVSKEDTKLLSEDED